MKSNLPLVHDLERVKGITKPLIIQYNVGNSCVHFYKLLKMFDWGKVLVLSTNFLI